MFLTDAAISLLDATLVLGLGLHLLTEFRGMAAFLTLGASAAIYVLMAITPMVPKRFFLPITLFNPVSLLAVLPIMIFHYDWLPRFDWVVSFCQVLLGLGILFWVQGGFKFRWPFVVEEKIGDRPFSWLNFLGFVAVNAFLLLPGIVIYLAISASVAVNHFSAGFLAMNTDGLKASAKTYVRNDGKTIELIPMMHIAQPGFYGQVAKSFPTNSIVLLEGVTDKKKLIKVQLSYQRAAATLGLATQDKEFAPTNGELRPADIDVSAFSASTLELLNLVSRLHSQGPSVPLLMEMIQKPPSPVVEERLWGDLLTKRNEHVLGEIKTALEDSDHVIVPWGAAHMPGLTHGIQESGFTLDRSRDYSLVDFRRGAKRQQPLEK